MRLLPFAPSLLHKKSGTNRYISSNSSRFSLPQCLLTLLPPPTTHFQTIQKNVAVPLPQRRRQGWYETVHFIKFFTFFLATMLTHTPSTAYNAFPNHSKKRCGPPPSKKEAGLVRNGTFSYNLHFQIDSIQAKA